MICYETITQYCCEDISLIENYQEAVNSKEKYDCHHRLEIQGDKVISVQELKGKNLYYNRPANELIFLRHTVHVAMHGKITPHRSHEAWNKGTKYFNNGEIELQANECPIGFTPGRLPRSKEWSERISKSRKANPTPLTPELRQKLRDSHLGYHASKETREKLSKSGKGRHWYNNGVINKFEKECPEGFVLGKLPHNKSSKDV